MSIFRSVLKWTFKFTSWPSVPNFLFVVLMEVLHTAGLAILCFMALPHLDSVSALLLTASLAVVPACLLLLSRRGFTVILRLTLLFYITCCYLDCRRTMKGSFFSFGEEYRMRRRRRAKIPR